MLYCEFCKKEIDIKNEKYVHVEDWEKKKMVKDIWCHLSCFKKAMNRDLTELERIAKDFLEKSSNTLNRLTNQEEEYMVL